MAEPVSIDRLTEQLAEHAYLADRGLATVLTLALALEKPVLLEGEAGVGKTEAAKALALVTELLAQNKLVIKVQTFPFKRAPEAYRISQGGHIRGKLVLVP